MNKITRALVAAVVLSTLLLSGTATAAAPPEASEEAVSRALQSGTERRWKGWPR
jgi:outer membrane murein-binding lipoprotein Lpp